MYNLRWKILVSVLCCIIMVLFFYFNFNTQVYNDSDMKDHLIKVKKEMLSLDSVMPGAYTDSILMYFRYYGLNFDDKKGKSFEHLFGTFQSDTNTLAGHIFRPKDYKATIILLHGYFEHCGQLNHLIYYLLQNGYAVAAFDLPGHGLSNGELGAIDNFSRYTLALKNFVNIIDEKLHGPYYLIGHSTGAAIALDYLFTAEDCFFGKVVLVAPLIHNNSWNLSRISYKIANPFINRFPRKFRNNSSNKDYLDFIKTKDPMQLRTISLKWFKAFLEWNSQIVDYNPSNKQIYIIQGMNDKSVDWEYNIKCICDKFCNTEVGFIDKGRHALLNESYSRRNEVFSQINEYLEHK